jgi:hypothetical protein
MNNKSADELWVLTRVIDASDAVWDCHATILGTPEKIRSMFDLSKGVPFGWKLFKGKQARRFLRYTLREELRYQRDKAAREKAGSN